MTANKPRRWFFVTNEPKFSTDWELGFSLAGWLQHAGHEVSSRGFGSALPKAPVWMPWNQAQKILLGYRGEARYVLTSRDPRLLSVKSAVAQIITTNPAATLDATEISTAYLPYPIADEYFEMNTMAAVFEMTRRFRLEHRPRVVFGGDYHDGAGLSVLFSAARTVLHGQGELVLLNGLAYRDRLAPVVKTLGLEEVAIFLPPLSAREESAIFHSADLYVEPSSKPEWFPVAALRAMAARLPIVAWETSLMTALSNRGALMVAPDRDDAWASAMTEALENQPLRERMMERTTQGGIDSHRLSVVGKNFLQMASQWCGPGSTKF